MLIVLCVVPISELRRVRIVEHDGVHLSFLRLAHGGPGFILDDHNSALFGQSLTLRVHVQLQEVFLPRDVSLFGQTVERVLDRAAAPRYRYFLLRQSLNRNFDRVFRPRLRLIFLSHYPLARPLLQAGIWLVVPRLNVSLWRTTVRLSVVHIARLSWRVLFDGLLHQDRVFEAGLVEIRVRLGRFDLVIRRLQVIVF